MSLHYYISAYVSLQSVSFSPSSLSHSPCLSYSLCVHVFFCLSFICSLSLPFTSSVCLSVSLCICHFSCLSHCFSVCLSLSDRHREELREGEFILSLWLSISRSFSLSFSLSDISSTAFASLILHSGYEANVAYKSWKFIASSLTSVQTSCLNHSAQHTRLRGHHLSW